MPRISCLYAINYFNLKMHSTYVADLLFAEVNHMKVDVGYKKESVERSSGIKSPIPRVRNRPIESHLTVKSESTISLKRNDRKTRPSSSCT
jgi:hypothetical protein